MHNTNASTKKEPGQNKEDLEKRQQTISIIYYIYVEEISSQALNIQWVMVFYEAAGKDERAILYSMLFNIHLLPLPTPEAMHADVKWTFRSSPFAMTYWLMFFIVMGFNPIFFSLMSFKGKGNSERSSFKQIFKI